MTPCGASRPLLLLEWILLAATALSAAQTAPPPRALGALSGHILSSTAEPVAGVDIVLFRRTFLNGVPLFALLGQNDRVTTNAAGEFRFSGLAQGRYFLAATDPRPMHPRSIPGSGATTYFPGSTNIADAQPVALKAGEFRDGITITLTPPHATATISGIVVDTNRNPILGRRMAVTAMPRPTAFLTASSFTGPVDTNGAFQIGNVPPGTYVLRSAIPPPADAPPRYRVQTLFARVTVDTSDVFGVVLAPLRNVTVSGRVSPDTASTPFLNPPALSVNVRPEPETDVGSNGPPVAVNADGTFELIVAAVPSRLEVIGATMVVKSIQSRGADVTDKPLPLQDDLSGVNVEVTTRPSEVLITLAPGTIGRNERVAIEVFPQNREAWHAGTRGFSRSDGPARAGLRFPSSNLPPGAYYAIAVDAIDFGEWRDPEILERLSRVATPFVLHDRERLPLELPLLNWKD